MAGPGRNGLMMAMRLRAQGFVRLLLTAFLLQFALPLAGMTGPLSAQAGITGPLSVHAGITGPLSVHADDAIAVCSANGIHYVHFDGTPAEAEHADRQSCLFCLPLIAAATVSGAATLPAPVFHPDRGILPRAALFHPPAVLSPQSRPRAPPFPT